MIWFVNKIEKLRKSFGTVFDILTYRINNREEVLSSGSPIRYKGMSPKAPGTICWATPIWLTTVLLLTAAFRTVIEGLDTTPLLSSCAVTEAV